MNQAIEANIVRPELPEEADRVEQLLVNILFLLINRTENRHTEHRQCENQISVDHQNFALYP